MFWLGWIFVAVWAFLQLQQTGYSPAVMRGLLIAVASLVAEHGLQGPRASVVEAPRLQTQALELWPTDLAAPRQLGHSWIRDQTRVSCIGRRILYH